MQKLRKRHMKGGSEVKQTCLEMKKRIVFPSQTESENYCVLHLTLNFRRRKCRKRNFFFRIFTKLLSKTIFIDKTKEETEFK